MPFAAGMRVRLRSGGPVMTIRAVDDDSVACEWFDKVQTLRKAVFLTVMIDDADHLAELLERVRMAKDAKPIPPPDSTSSEQ